MNKKLMLLGLCALSVFSTVQADEEQVNDTAAVEQETTVATPAAQKETAAKDKSDDCGCKK